VDVWDGEVEKRYHKKKAAEENILCALFENSWKRGALNQRATILCPEGKSDRNVKKVRKN